MACDSVRGCTCLDSDSYAWMRLDCAHFPTVSALMRYCAMVMLKTSFGPTISTFGTNPLNSAAGPSCFMRSLNTLIPPT